MVNDFGAHAVVRALKNLDIKIVFGIPGIHNLDIYDVLIDSEIEHITARNEAGAAFMADGYARATGKPGVLLTISGPGLTNALTGLAQARHDASPLLCISSDIPRAARGTGYLHELPDAALTGATVCKYAVMVEDPARIEGVLSAAYHDAASGRPGPVNVQIPLDVLRARLTGVPENVEQALVLLRNAGSIACIVGGGAAGTADDARSFVEAIGAVAVETCAGKGVIGDDHPLSLGGRLHSAAVREYIAGADVVVGIGTHFSPTDLWVDRLRLQGALVQINTDPADAVANCSPDVVVQGDAGVVLRALTAAATPSADAEARRETARAMAVELRGRADTELPATLGQPEAAVERMRAVIGALNRALGADGTLVADMTTIAYCALSEFRCARPRAFLHPVGFGTLGFALPAAVGVRAAQPDAAVAVLVGDGGFQFTMQEFGVAAQQGMPIPVVVWNDGGYGEIRREQELRHAGKRIAVDNLNPDFVALAQSYGRRAVRVDGGEVGMQVYNAVVEALSDDGPTVIEVMAVPTGSTGETYRAVRGTTNAQGASV